LVRAWACFHWTAELLSKEKEELGALSEVM
jgi:hypothetical protein